ncbi:hypothetical protein MB27_35545 [Actinoplanes utahensis]|uniref:Acyltransferase n=1 Tax=Actinoplanes utahensis TaxID=1869 RepID=A0A0A6UE44_ACTUT|nr:hypothetical protein MB27_35545 [Actinoplanes utahensis]
MEGLRAIAVTLVVLSHAGIGRFEGGYVGVDVFFVISGFLITTLLLAEQARAGRISLSRFYARRALRLLPVATVTVLATVAAAWFFMPATRFHEITVDAVYSTFYGMNWRLAAQGVDYLAAAAEPSPLQHLWSLAVEEQFYVVWPLLIMITFRSRRLLIGTLTTLAVVSLGMSIWQTGEAAPWAYFGSHTRAWELGVGALLAVGAARVARMPAGLAVTLSWIGLLAIFGSALTFTEETSFPGYAALLPVLGTAAVIAAGMRPSRGGAHPLLGIWPMRQIGKLSYGWYLWHWPILMIGPYALDKEPTLGVDLALAAGSLVLALITYHLVENPFRNSKPLRAKARTGLAVGLALSSLTALAGGFGSRHTPPVPTAEAAPGLAAGLDAATDPQARMTALITASIGATRMPENLTPPVTSPAELPAHNADKCHVDHRDNTIRPCVYGDPAGKKTMFLIGDSHAGHWFTTVDAIARANNWRLIALTKSACQIADVLVYQPALKRSYDECPKWRDAVFARVQQEKPNLLVFASHDGDNGGLLKASGKPVAKPVGAQNDGLWAQAWANSFARVRGIPAVLIQDTPWPNDIVPNCLTAHPKKIDVCNSPVGKAITLPQRRALIARAAKAAGIRVIDPTPWFCTDICPVVIGDTLVYRDKGHMTVAFARTLTPLLGPALFPPAKKKK